MRTISLPKVRLEEVIERQKMATMAQLKEALGSQLSMTVYRKLNELGYLSSCSHSGRYYTLLHIPEFDRLGLWFHESVLFSSHGTLFETISSIVVEAEAGYSALEIEKLLNIKPNEVLLKLIKNNCITRKKMDGSYIYFSTCENDRLKQELCRNKFNRDQEPDNTVSGKSMSEIKASVILFYCTLNEKQKRLYAGLESLKLGRSGNKAISEFLGVNIKTVAKGKKELLSDSVNEGTIRTPGGGRKKRRRNI
jgi:hypothetical protein